MSKCLIFVVLLKKYKNPTMPVERHAYKFVQGLYLGITAISRIKSIPVIMEETLQVKLNYIYQTDIKIK